MRLWDLTLDAIAYPFPGGPSGTALLLLLVLLVLFILLALYITRRK